MTQWMLPWIADDSNVPGLRNIIEGLKLDGYPYGRLAEKPFSGPLLDKLEPILDNLELSDQVIVATNSLSFQSYSLANILPVVWSLTTRQRAYTADTPEILKTLLKFSSWEGDYDQVDAKKRLESYPLLVWNGIEKPYKATVGNAAIVASMLHRRSFKVESAQRIDCKTLAIYLYSGDFSLDRMEEELSLALGSSLASTVMQGFACIKAHFKVAKPGVLSI